MLYSVNKWMKKKLHSCYIVIALNILYKSCWTKSRHSETFRSNISHFLFNTFHILIISQTLKILKYMKTSRYLRLRVYPQNAQFYSSTSSNFRRYVTSPLLFPGYEEFIMIMIKWYNNAATFGAFALGNVIAWPSSVLEQIDLSDSTESWIVSIFMIGAALVPWIACTELIMQNQN